MDFTREPIIQTVITPKDGCKIVVRSSKNSGQEEYFVDAVEVVSFGTAIFFRSLERPKSFLVPASDYEVLEVREARMVLKNVGIDRAIKIGGGRDAAVRSGRDHAQEKPESAAVSETETSEEKKQEVKTEQRVDKKRDRRRNARRRRGRDDAAASVKDEDSDNEEGEKIESVNSASATEEGGELLPLTSVLTSLLPPPPTLISETIARYRDNASFRGAFFAKEDHETPVQAEEVVDDVIADAENEGEEDDGFESPKITLPQPEFGSFEMTEEEEEEIYQERHIDHHEEKVESLSPEVEESSENPESKQE